MPTARSDALTRYQARLRQVLDHIDTHLDEDLTVERLAAVAAFSKFHFLRQFSQSLGMGAARYVQLRRLKRASYRLAFRGNESVLEIALASGYEGPEAFARAFRGNVGSAPSAFRAEPQWEAWHNTFAPLQDLRNQHMPIIHRREEVRIIETADTPIALLEHRGAPRTLGDSIRSFIEWRKANRLPPTTSATYNILYDDPDQTPPEDFRFGLAAATSMTITPNPQGITASLIPGGRCAVLRHTGSDESLGASVRYLYVDWLPQSGEELRDFPAYMQRLTFFPNVPEHEAQCDISLPLK